MPEPQVKEYTTVLKDREALVALIQNEGVYAFLPNVVYPVRVHVLESGGRVTVRQME